MTFPVNQLRSREHRKLHFRESGFTNFPGEGGMPPDHEAMSATSVSGVKFTLGFTSLPMNFS